MPYCKNCGTKYEHKTKFCEQCGFKLNDIISEDHICTPTEKPLTSVSINNNIENTSKLSNDIKVNSVPMKFKLKSKNLILIGSFMIFLLISITIYNMFLNNKIVGIPIEKLNQLKMIDYFPHEIGSSFKYLILPSKTNSPVYEKDVITDIPGTDPTNSTNSYKIGIETYSDLNNGKLTTDSFYEINQDIVKMYHSETPLGLSEDQKIMLSKNSKWERDKDTTCYITEINMNITTKSQTFNNCIEVTVVEHQSNDIKTYNYSKEYYSTKVGLVLEKHSSDHSSNCDTITSELVSYNIPEQSQQNNATTYTSPNDSTTTSPTYINKTYKFTLDIPKGWDKKYIVEEGNWANDAEKTFDFSLIANGKNYGNIFSIIILKKEYDKDYVKNTAYEYITTNNGHVIAYSIPTGPTTDLVNNPTEMDILSKMINDDVPQIIKSIKFQ